MSTSFHLFTADSGPAAGKETNSWYALRVKSRFEFVTSAALRNKGYEQFLPSYRTRRTWSDRVKEIEMALFPGYMFCRFDASDPYRVLNTAGVVHVVSAGSVPLPIGEREVAAVQGLCRSGLGIRPWPFLEVGRRVLVERGPLTGTEGIVVKVKNEYRIVASISILRRSVSAEIERDWVRAIRS